MANRIQQALALLPLRFQWAPHNVVAHPLSEIAFQFGFKRLSIRIHDATAPEDDTVRWRPVETHTKE